MLSGALWEISQKERQVGHKALLAGGVIRPQLELLLRYLDYLSQSPFSGRCYPASTPAPTAPAASSHKALLAGGVIRLQENRMNILMDEGSQSPFSGRCYPAGLVSS